MSAHPPAFADSLRHSEQSLRDALTSQQIDRLFERGRSWNLGPVLAAGGSALFPHASLPNCGHHTASVVEGCLDSGADQILALGVVHPLTDPIWGARQRIWSGEDPMLEPLRGIHPQGTPLTEGEYSLRSFAFLLEEGAKRRGVLPPRLIERYPFLAAGDPASLPGLSELQSLLSDSALVMTGDLVHHGRAYGTPPDDFVPMGPEAVPFASDRISQMLTLLAAGRYQDYFDAACANGNDAEAGGQVLRHLLGPFNHTLHDIVPCETDSIYHGFSPSWVAASLITFQKA
jgi:hypothetical protein